MTRTGPRATERAITQPLRRGNREQECSRDSRRRPPGVRSLTCFSSRSIPTTNMNRQMPIWLTARSPRVPNDSWQTTNWKSPGCEPTEQRRPKHNARSHFAHDRWLPHFRKNRSKNTGCNNDCQELHEQPGKRFLHVTSQLERRKQLPFRFRSQAGVGGSIFTRCNACAPGGRRVDLQRSAPLKDEPNPEPENEQGEEIDQGRFFSWPVPASLRLCLTATVARL